MCCFLIACRFCFFAGTPFGISEYKELPNESKKCKMETAERTACEFRFSKMVEILSPPVSGINSDAHFRSLYEISKSVITKIKKYDNSCFSNRRTCLLWINV